MKSLTDQFAELQTTKRQKAVKDYVAILQREQHPRDGDVAGLEAALQVLDRKPENVPGDLEVARRMSECERILTGARAAEADASARSAQAGERLAAAQQAALAAHALVVKRSAEFDAISAEYPRLTSESARARGDLADGNLHFESVVTGEPLDTVRKRRRQAEQEAEMEAQRAEQEARWAQPAESAATDQPDA